MPAPASLPEALAPLAAWLAVNAPGSIPAGTVEVPIANGTRMVLPFSPVPVAAVQAPAPEADWVPPEEEPVFVPSVFQNAILEALEGKALRTDALGAQVRDRSRLFKTGGLRELIQEGLVSHHRRLGYYRADAPPPNLAAELGG